MKSDSCLHKALVCHAISDVVMYSSKKSLVWLIEESPKVILKENNNVWGSHVNKFIEIIENILSLIKYKPIFLEPITRLISEPETISGSIGSWACN